MRSTAPAVYDRAVPDMPGFLRLSGKSAKWLGEAEIRIYPTLGRT